MTNSFMIERRALMQRMMALVGASAVASIGSPLLARKGAAAKTYLDAPHMATLAAFAETVIPRTDTAGAIEAGVPQVVDGLLANWASGPRRVELARALTEIDELSAKAQGKPFAALAPDARLALLKPHDKAATTPLPRTGPVAAADMMSGPKVANPGYAKLKELVITAYYFSEAALTQELPYVHAPGKWVPSVPVTPQTRPDGGVSY
ncbi:gluconate 2-dehydrogenase subunit 3 family protein [Novosphingobium bradum]|uniref:Gluconate 2-dehydrogenase subunit 3 family protein n=1 Tax=Novosphingobium bradum TaxID=1737444 RepID=A0ABV7ITR1_9SPHN